MLVVERIGLFPPQPELKKSINGIATLMAAKGFMFHLHGGSTPVLRLTTNLREEKNAPCIALSREDLYKRRVKFRKRV